MIEKLKFTIRKIRHDRFGQSSERGALLNQLGPQLADLEADAAQAEAVVQMAAGAASEKMIVATFERPGRRADRRPSICRASGSSIPAPAGPAKRSASRPPHRTGRANVRGRGEIRLHLPLSRQSAVYVRESVDLDVSTLADWVDAAAGMLCRW